MDISPFDCMAAIPSGKVYLRSNWGTVADTAGNRKTGSGTSKLIGKKL
jgi:hypothetical protein